MLLHPVVLAALGLWALNDHVLKGLGPGWLTGKLSDFACLIVVPVMLAAAVELWRSRGSKPFAPAQGWLVVGAFVAAGTMVLINLWSPAAWAYEQGLGLLQWPLRALGSWVAGERPGAPIPVVLTMDPWDVVATPFAFVPLWLVSGRRSDQPERRAFEVPQVRGVGT